MSAKNSKYGAFFTIGNGLAICKICSTYKIPFRPGTSTNCLSNHLRSHHQEEFKKFIERQDKANASIEQQSNKLKRQQQTLRNAISVETSTSLDSELTIAIASSQSPKQPRIDHALS